jgi:hypothetical protein
MLGGVIFSFSSQMPSLNNCLLVESRGAAPDNAVTVP